MRKFGMLVAKNRILVIIFSVVLFIPSLYFMNMTKVNYDILSYLPEDLESTRGQKILNDVFSNGTNIYLILEEMETPDILEFKKVIKQIKGIESVLWIDDMVDPTIPSKILPENLRKIFFSENSTMMIVTASTIDTEEVAKVTKQMRTMIKAHPQATNIYLSGMPVLLNDTSDLVLAETNKYVAAAGLLAIIIMYFTLESTFVPIILLITMGFSVLYNMGTNVILGEISYITKSLVIVLQLGVTMDYSIFLYHRFEEEKTKTEDKNSAMANAISNTFVSIAGSSLTTIAGFLSLCAMKLGLGWDMGLVMAKGVIIGVLAAITILPALLLTFNSLIERNCHRTLLPAFEKVSFFVTKNYKFFLVLLIVLIGPSIYGERNTKVYYNLDESLPREMESVVALEKLRNEYKMTTVHTIITSPKLPAFGVSQMGDELERVDGINNVICYEKIIGPGIPESFVSDDIKKMFKRGGYGLILLNTGYKSGSMLGNNQLDIINEIVKEFDADSIVAGEGALTRDLMTIADVDFRNVNILSVISIFIIIGILFTSFIIPLLLVSTIELAIIMNMAVSYYTNTTIPFIASVVIGCIQLGATVDYAILLTGRFREELETTKNKSKAMEKALKNSIGSIVTSSATFFGATAMVGMLSSMDIIKTLCVMIARGALISMAVIILILPSLLLAFESIIAATTINWKSRRRKMIYDKT